MNKFKKTLAEMKLSQWIISTMWAMTFIMLLAFVGVVSGLTDKAGKHKQQHWTYELTKEYKDANSGAKSSRAPRAITISQDVKDFDFTKKQPGLSEGQIAQVKRATTTFTEATKTYAKELKEAGKDKVKIKAAASKFQAATLVWKPFAIMALISSNKDQNGNFHKVSTVDDIYNKELAQALAIGTDNTPKKLSEKIYLPEAKKASTAIAASGLTFFSLLTIAIFGTAIIKFKEKQGGK